MSWGYWGIVAGLLVMLTLFFFCIDILYDTGQRREAEKTEDPVGRRSGGAGTKHAA